MALCLASHVHGQKISALPTRASGALSANGSVWLPIYDSGSPATTYRVSVATLGTVLGAGVVPDGDKGDITVSLTGNSWVIDNSAVSLAKIANISSARLLGRSTAGSGVIEELPKAAILTLINVEDGADVTDSTNVDAAGAVMTSDATVSGYGFVSNDTTMSADSSTKVITEHAVKTYVDTAIAGVSGAGVADGDKGDITVSSTGSVWSVDTGAITYAKMQDVSATSRILGRITAGAGDVEELTAANVLTLIGVEAGADVTDATNVDAAGAVMNSDASTASMSFVIDEDSFATNSATKVPTQQSVKAYVDANSGGGAADSFTAAADGDATPSVTGVTVLQVNNTAGTTITAFDNGTTAQRIVVQVLDANTSIANNSSIKLHGSASRPSQTGGYVVNLRYSGTQWVEESIGSSFAATVSVLNDGSDNVAITNPVTDADVALKSTGSGSTVALAVAGTNRLTASNTGVDVTGSLTIGGNAIVENDGTLGGGSPSTTSAPSESAVQTYVAANAGSVALIRFNYSGMNIFPGLGFGAGGTGTVLTTGSPDSNTLTIHPIWIGSTVSITALRAEQTTGAAANTMQLVLYDSDSNGKPNSLLEESDEIDISTNGVKTYSFASPRSLTPGVYWVGMTTPSGTWRVVPTSVQPAINVPLSVTTTHTCLARSGIASGGAIPTTWTFSSSEFAVKGAPVCVVVE